MVFLYGHGECATILLLFLLIHIRFPSPIGNFLDIQRRAWQLVTALPSQFLPLSCEKEREKEGTRRTSQNQTTQPRTTREGDKIACYGCSSCLTTNCPLTRDMYGKSSKISASCEWARFHDLSPLAGAGAGMKKSPNLTMLW